MFELNDYLLFIFIILAVIFVFRSRKIPEAYNILGIVIGLTCHVIQDGLSGFLYSTFGIVAGLIISLFLYYFKALSMEDIILFVAIGSFLGFEDILYTSMYTIFFGLVIGAMMLLVKRTKLMNKVWNKCTEWLNSITTYVLREVVLQSKQAAIQFPIIYATLPALILHYLSSYGKNPEGELLFSLLMQ